MNTSINNIIACNEPHANLDTYYGPYSSLQEALDTLNTETVAGVTYTKRAVGLSVGILENDEVVEYWFKAGTADADLVKKISETPIPEGAKVVTFDDCYAEGVQGIQNPILTDANGNFAFPQPTITKSGELFNNWVYNNHNYNPGQTATVTTSTVVGATWVVGLSVSFTAGTNVNSITGTANGVPFTSGTLFKSGTHIVLAANVPSDYNVTWTDAPIDATISGNTLSLTIGVLPVNVTATAQKVSTTNTITFSGDRNTSAINGFCEGAPILISPATVNGGSIITLEAIPDTGYQFKHWTKSPGGNIFSKQNPLIFTAKDDLSVAAVTEQEQQQTYTLTFNKGRHIDSVSGMCNGATISSPAIVNAGSVVKLTAVPDDGCQFSTWSSIPGVPDLTENPIKFEVNSDLIISASGSAVSSEYTVNWNDDIDNVQITGTYTKGATSGDVSNGQAYPAGSTVILTATPASGYTISEWTDTPSGAVAEGNTLRFELNDNTDTIGASVIQLYRVSWTSQNITGFANGNEFISGTSFVSGTQIVLTATPELGYVVTGWTNKPTSYTESGNNLSFTLTEDVIDVAVTTAPGYTISWDNPSNGNIKGYVNNVEFRNGQDLFASGTTIKLVGHGNRNYIFDEWLTYPQESRISENELVFVLGNSNVTGITAATVQGFTVEWEKSENGEITGQYTYRGNTRNIDNGELYPVNSSIVLTATPNEGYIFTSWEHIPSGLTPKDNPLTFTLNANTSTISANIRELQQYRVNFNSEEGVNGITGMVDGEPIEEIPAELTENSVIVLIAELDTGEYNVVKWKGLPSDYVISGEYGEELTFTLTGDTDILASGKHLYQIKYEPGTGISKITGELDGEIIESGSYVIEDSEVILTAYPEEDYVFESWSDSSVDNPHAITVTSDVNITATGRSAITFYYYDCGDPNDPSYPKYFRDISELNEVNSNNVVISNNEHNVLYAIVEDGFRPTCVYNGRNDFGKLADCRDEDIQQAINEVFVPSGWIESPDSSQTAGDLAQLINGTIYVLVDDDLASGGDVTIKIEHE